MSEATPGPWETSKHQQGDLEDEWGVYPPLGEAGPVALVAGEANARLIAAAPELLEACEAQEKYNEHAENCGDCEEWGPGNCAEGVRVFIEVQRLTDVALNKVRGKDRAGGN